MVAVLEFNLLATVFLCLSAMKESYRNMIFVYNGSQVEFTPRKIFSLTFYKKVIYLHLEINKQ